MIGARQVVNRHIKVVNAHIRNRLIRSMCLCLALFAISCGEIQDSPPNIVLIMADDLGYGDLSCYGNKTINTPSLDKLAQEGLKFTDYHSNGSVCSPTRAALLTGRYQQRSGMEGVIYAKGKTRQTGLQIDEVTIADHLKSKGYRTGIVGKWHLGYRVDYNPIYQGFDFFRGYVSGNVDYHSHVDGAGIPDWWHNLEKRTEDGYVTDLITKYALDFIEQNQDSTFFLYVAHESPHYPFQGRNDKPDRVPGQTDFIHHGSRPDKKGAYKEMIEVMDEGIGDIIKKLEELELEQKTLVFFCSDNGGLSEVADNGNLRGAKGSLWEGGHRVPAIAYWPGTIKAASTSAVLTMSMDVFPTVVSLTGPNDYEAFDFDGLDLKDHMISQKSLPKRTVFWKYRDAYAARSGNMKLLINDDSTYLFDLSNDISEQVNLHNVREEASRGLQSQLNLWYESVTKGVDIKTR